MIGTVNQVYRFYFSAMDSSGLPASGINSADFTVIVRNPQDTATMSAPTLSEVDNTGLYYFDIDASFTDAHGVGTYGVQVSYNSIAPAAQGTVTEVVEFYMNNLDQNISSRATVGIMANPGQVVGIAIQVLDANGERIDGYSPQVDYVIDPSGMMLSGFPIAMSHEAVGLYKSNIHIPFGIHSTGTYIVSTSWTNPVFVALKQYKVFLINVSLPFGVSSVSPA